MSTSNAQPVGYRVLQAVCDLRSVAFSAEPHVAERIAAGSDGIATPADFKALVAKYGCRLCMPAHQAMHGGLVVAATLTEDDPEAFRVATAILLADRLQGGLGQDDMFWHWDAFQPAYRALSPPDRAAILQGYARATTEGLVDLLDPPDGSSTATLHANEVAIALDGVTGVLGDIAQMLQLVLDGSQPSGLAAEAWAGKHREIQSVRVSEAAAVLKGFRHIYETRRDFNPFPHMEFDTATPGPPVIPVLR